MMKRNLILFLLLSCVVLLISVKIFNSHKKTIYLGNSMFSVTTADTEKSREKGLSGRTSLVTGEGLLFIFEKESRYGFWMKDMNFDIDIIWINEEQKIIGFEKNASKNSYPQVFYPPAPIKFVLEVKAGSIDERRIKVGDLLSPTF